MSPRKPGSKSPGTVTALARRLALAFDVHADPVGRVVVKSGGVKAGGPRHSEIFAKDKSLSSFSAAKPALIP